MIALARAAHGGEGQVLVDEVDAVHHQPVAEALVVFDGAIPTRHTIGLGERAPAQLVRNAGHLLDGEQHVRILAVEPQPRAFQHVDAWHVLERIQATVRRRDPGVRPFMLHPVAGEL